ncbi:MAG: sensor histidine kinase, partial [Halohasta sp.]
GRIEMIDDDHAAVVERNLDRMETIIEDVLTLARQDESVEDTESVDLGALATECWDAVETADATLSTDDGMVIEADRSRCRQLLENLIRNAVEHGREDVSVRVGRLAEEGGFYIEDDGPGIPEDERGSIFEMGYTTNDEGTGFGLSIVAEIAEAHGWTVGVTESDAGGARFEFTGVELLS